MKVPSDPDNPTYDHTFHVGFMRWLKSSGPERKEWARRRNAAIHTSKSVRYAKEREAQAQAKKDQRDAEREARRQG